MEPRDRGDRLLHVRRQLRYLRHPGLMFAGSLPRGERRRHRRSEGTRRPAIRPASLGATAATAPGSPSASACAVSPRRSFSLVRRRWRLFSAGLCWLEAPASLSAIATAWRGILDPLARSRAQLAVLELVHDASDRLLLRFRLAWHCALHLQRPVFQRPVPRLGPRLRLAAAPKREDAAAGSAEKRRRPTGRVIRNPAAAAALSLVAYRRRSAPRFPHLRIGARHGPA